MLPSGFPLMIQGHLGLFLAGSPSPFNVSKSESIKTFLSSPSSGYSPKLSLADEKN